MKERVNKYGPVITQVLKTAHLPRPCKTTDDLLLYGFHEYTGLRRFWRKFRMGVNVKRHEHKG